MNNIFLNTYLQLISEWSQTGLQSIYNFPKSYKIGLYQFNISKGHSNEKDFARCFTEQCGEKLAYQILDEACYQILSKYKSLIFSKTTNSIKFNCPVKIEFLHTNTLYFNIVIGFLSTKRAFLYTTIDITKKKFLYLHTITERIDNIGEINYIVPLHDFLIAPHE